MKLQTPKARSSVLLHSRALNSGIKHENPARAMVSKLIKSVFNAHAKVKLACQRKGEGGPCAVVGVKGSGSRAGKDTNSDDHTVSVLSSSLPQARANRISADNASLNSFSPRGNFHPLAQCPLPQHCPQSAFPRMFPRGIAQGRQDDCHIPSWRP